MTGLELFILAYVWLVSVVLIAFGFGIQLAAVLAGATFLALAIFFGARAVRRSNK